MRLVPKQLLRTGMTGQVPYYGGRLSPTQAYAASHPSRQPPPTVPGQSLPGASAAQTLAALQHLLDAGVITAEEYARIRARVIT